MRVCLIAHDLTVEPAKHHLLAQVRLFLLRGDEVCLALSSRTSALPDELADLEIATSQPLAACELYIYHYCQDFPLLASIMNQDRALVLVHDHGAAPHEWLPPHYADLCLVNNKKRREQLVNDWGIAPERVLVLPDAADQAAYRAAVTQMVDRALADDWPPVPRVEQRSASEDPEAKATTGHAAFPALAHSQADIMLREYVVCSRVRGFGRLIAWVRRNLTSHLREPYLDPTLERQVAFNQTIVAWMEQIQDQLQELQAQVQLLNDGRPGAEEVRDGTGQAVIEESDIC